MTVAIHWTPTLYQVLYCLHRALWFPHGISTLEPENILIPWVWTLILHRRKWVAEMELQSGSSLSSAHPQSTGTTKREEKYSWCTHCLYLLSNPAILPPPYSHYHLYTDMHTHLHTNVHWDLKMGMRLVVVCGSLSSVLSSCPNSAYLVTRKVLSFLP